MLVAGISFVDFAVCFSNDCIHFFRRCGYCPNRLTLRALFLPGHGDQRRCSFCIKSFGHPPCSFGFVAIDLFLHFLLLFDCFRPVMLVLHLAPLHVQHQGWNEHRCRLLVAELLHRLLKVHVSFILVVHVLDDTFACFHIQLGVSLVKFTAFADFCHLFKPLHHLPASSRLLEVCYGRVRLLASYGI